MSAMLEKISCVLEEKINVIHDNEEIRNILLAKIVAYNLGDIDVYLDNNAQQERVQLNRWYNQSYPVFIKNARSFVECNDIITIKELLINLVTNTMSWIARIPRASVHDMELVTRIHELSRNVSSQTYNTCTIDTYNTTNDIYLRYDNNVNININEFARLINSLINGNDNFNNFPTVTKLMHFINPNIFPIFDKHVRNVLLGHKNAPPTGKQYINYMHALHNLFNSPTYSALLTSLTTEVNTSLRNAGCFSDLSTLRIIDLMLFDESMD